MRYDIIDTQLGDYVAPYDEDAEYWTLEKAQDLAYRRQEEVCDMEETDQEKDRAYDYLSKILKMTTEDEIRRALAIFDYELVKHEE